jgi:hypothetical protein
MTGDNELSGDLPPDYRQESTETQKGGEREGTLSVKRPVK